MQKRVNIISAEPQALKAMTGLVDYISKVSVSKTLRNLIKIRSSQINGCAYCIDMHTKEALKGGETHQRIFLLNGWKEADGIFSEEEQMALAITEEVTLIHQHGLSDKTYEKALQLFSEKQIAEIIMTVVVINSWNRIVLSSHLKIN